MNAACLKLKDLEILYFDCQATHSDPARGEVFEAGWLRSRASIPFSDCASDNTIETYLVELPDSKFIPRPILKITGLKQEEWRTAAAPELVWQGLSQAALQTAAKNKLALCPTVIHFARYETPFLRFFHKTFSPDSKFPFFILCTHEIIRRLIPGLPRKGLRTAAGYFGCALPDERRSRHHLKGTHCIWQHIVELLDKNEGISSLHDLILWLKKPQSVSPRLIRREYPLAKNFRKSLPDLPGVYRMFRSNGDLLYIGKAKSLKNRVNSYFQNKGRHSEHILDMLSQAKSLTYSVTGSVLESALRESDEIKALAPPFNIALRASGEGPYFFSADFKSLAERPGPQHRIGPLPAKKYILSLSSISDILNCEQSPVPRQIMQLALATPDEYLPSEEIFRRGIDVFKELHRGQLKLPATFQSLMRFGSLLWKERLEQLKEKEESGPEEDETPVLSLVSQKPEKKKRKIDWNPESVSKRLRHSVRVGTFLIRRTRWYYLLTESCLTWKDLGCGQKLKNLLVIRNGQPEFKDTVPVTQEIPLPPGCLKSNLEKQKNFDIYTYDRMGILTAEIRKLSKDNNGSVELRLGPRNRLGPKRLQKILRWI